MKLEKEERDVLKLVLSSLFARKQKYLWINSSDSKTVYFSTIGHEMPLGKKTGNKHPPMGPVYAYKPTVDDFVHRVSFKDGIFTNAMRKAFPFCILGTTCINLQEFTTVLNKDLLDTLLPDKSDTSVDIEKHVKNRPSIVVNVATKVGKHFYNVIANYYTTFKRNVLCNENVSVVADGVTSKAGSRLTHVEIDFSKLSKITSDYLLKIPIYEGLTSISQAEYTKRSKRQGTTTIYLAPNKKAVGLVIIYEDDFVKVESIQPVSLWFPKIV